MKKVLAFLAIMLLPMSVMAMTPVTDNDLANVTGQAGVSINVDVTMDLDIDVAAWGDSDGFLTGSSAGWVGVTSLAVNTLHIWPRTDYNPDLNGTFADPTLYRLLTIDVGTDSGVTKVQIGIPTLTVTMESMTANVELGAAKTSLNQLMGTLYIAGLNMATTGYDKSAGTGFVYIYAHGNSGVDIDLVEVNIAYLKIDTVAWGDVDGLAAGYGHTCGMLPGYVGLKNLDIEDITVDGGITIDVGSNDTADTGCIYNAAPDHGVTFVAIGIKDGTYVTVGTLDASVALGGSIALGQKLGDIYVSNMTATISDNPITSTGSFVHIFAH